MMSAAKISNVVLAVFLFASSITSVLGQGSYTAQVRSTVTDPAHAVVNNAKVTVIALSVVFQPGTADPIG